MALLRWCGWVWVVLVLVLAFLLSLQGVHAASAQPARLPERAQPFYVMASVEGLYMCDEALAMPQLKSADQVVQECLRRGRTGAPSIRRLLDTLEPGGAKGQVQMGYLATLYLLDLYKRKGQQWVFDEAKLNAYLKLLSEVDRPVVVYLCADHFDSLGAIVDELVQDPRNLMQWSNGQPALLDYFGYRIVPYTLQTDEAIPVNRLRYEALRHVTRKIKALPKKVQDRIIAISLLGEVHHLYPDFTNGMGRYQDIQVTDYSPASVQGFRHWLAQRYGSVAQFNRTHGFQFTSWEQVEAPSQDIRKHTLRSFAQHYDAYAHGILPVFGWFWDPHQTVRSLDVYIDGKLTGSAQRGLNRLDVYRALDNVTDPNVGFHYALDHSTLSPGFHEVQVVAQSQNGLRHLLGESRIVVGTRDQQPPAATRSVKLQGLQPLDQLQGVRGYLDSPKNPQDVYYNPLAKDWDHYRQHQVRRFMQHFFELAKQAGLPAKKLYSHQILAEINSTWNPQLFATATSFEGERSFQPGLNLYGGATLSPWVQAYMKQHKMSDYGVPEFNPQQWKVPGIHLKAMRAHYEAGARFISPYLFTVVPQRFHGNEEHGVSAMTLSPDNKRDGSDQFFKAIVEFAAH